MKNKIQLFEPSIGINEEKSLLKILRSKYWASGSGDGHVSAFEQEFKNYVGSKDCIAVNSGTAALHLALSLLDVKGKEVILPALSFVSTAHAIIYNGGIPVFADVDPDTLCIDSSDIEKKITKKTVALLPVHFGGMPSNLKKIRDIAHNHKLTVVEDAAHACGSSYKKKKIGSHGEFVCFSFHPVKNLSMPAGGSICLNGKNAKKLRKILASKRWCGITDRKYGVYDVKNIGWNFYMNEFSAGLGLVQLKKLKKLNQIRKKIAKLYFKNINLDKKMPISDNCSYHLYWIQVKNRNRFRKKMFDAGIETGIHYTPIHQMSMYVGKTVLPVTEKVGKEVISLPMHPNLSDVQVEKIIKNVNKFI